MSRFPYEKVSVLSVPANASSPEEVLADFGKLDLWSNRLDSEYPVDDINYNEGKAKKSHPFHKISKYYGRNKDVFLFLSTLRDENVKMKIIKNISDRCSNDPRVMDDFTKKMKVYLNRTGRGELDADEFLKDHDLNAFFHGYHADRPGHSRNIHENLNVNVAKPRKSLGTSGYFTKKTIQMTVEKSELRRVKIYGNGGRIMTVFKDDDGKRNYTPTEEAEMDLEIGWVAKNLKGKELYCVVILHIKEGKIILKKMAVEGDEHNSVVSIPELARQNHDVLIRNKNLHDLLDKLVVHRTKEAAIEIACVVQSNQGGGESCEVHRSREKLTVQQVPKKSCRGEDEVYADFEKLNFSMGPFSSSDELNYNDGLEANPFDKITKVYGRQRNIFLLNDILVNPEKRSRVLKIVEENCKKMEDSAMLLQKFTTRMDIYLDRISNGAVDAKEALNDGVDGFFYGCYVAKKNHPRNIHSNLNVNITKNGQTLETTSLLTKPIPKMEVEKSKVERVKVFGNGKRIMTIVAGEKRQRNYLFSKLAKMELQIGWIGRETRSGREVECCLILEFKAGQISIKVSSIDGVLVKLATIYGYALENNEVLIRNKSLSRVVEEILDSRPVTGPPLTIESLKAIVKPRLVGAAAFPPMKYDCESQEIFRIVELMPRPLEEGKGYHEHPDYNELLNDYEKLDFSAGPFSPEDKLNYNDGLKAHPFNKIRKYYGRHKDIFLFIATLYDAKQREVIMNIIKRKCGNDVKAILEFEKDMMVFLDRAGQGRTDAVKFLDDDYSFAVVAFFGGYYVADQNHQRNVHSHLNIDVGVVNKDFFISDYFSRETPRYDLEKGELETIKIYGFGKRIATVNRLHNDQRNYTFTKLTEMNLNIKWKAMDAEIGKGGNKKERDCSVVIKIKNGDVTICKASINGKTVQSASILELAKQNDQVLFKNKTLYDVIQFYSLRAVIKGATTLFFTAASGTPGGDATTLNNNCTDVFLMLMLQDDEEKERILEMVSRKSATPAETRKEFQDRMDLFKTKFNNGDYVNNELQSLVATGCEKSGNTAAGGKGMEGKGGGDEAAPPTKGNDLKGEEVTEEDGKENDTTASEQTVTSNPDTAAGAAAAEVDDYVLIDENDLLDDEAGTDENQGTPK